MQAIDTRRLQNILQQLVNFPGIGKAFSRLFVSELEADKNGDS